ncbi:MULTISPECIES: GNAT family N-acetyltransferase [Exiguobacterium]|uniref:GNAT family N-acetyltransferase n=1 Tax=Exiguobacterium antarcticum TaxID=132920 RepID=A0ABT6R5L2_9BACL|nr:MULTISPECIES: GNAT family N-acetyltransferase [Exiguobacterium]MCT4780479.1 N-acetyltransferase [Exiguobacterium soli]MDI3236095.1 GNAT family N-acetyltransferase [Exiguobacterium antarcticum]
MELKRGDQKIEAYLDNQAVGEITYSDTKGGKWIIDHTYVDPKHRNQQIGEQLVKAIVEWAREENVKLLPLCPFAKREFEQTPDYADVSAQ